MLDDLFDLNRRPSAGVEHWRAAVATQLARVREDAKILRFAHRPGPVEGERPSGDGAEERLHLDVYTLVLAIRNVLRFHDAINSKLGDHRLAAARAEFLKAAPEARNVRDVYEHLDHYLLGTGNEPRLKGARAFPIVALKWHVDWVRVSVGELELELVSASCAAVALASETAKVWDEAYDRARAQLDRETPEDGDRQLELTMGVRTVIGGETREEPVIHLGILRDVLVRPSTKAEIRAARTKSRSAAPT